MAGAPHLISGSLVCPEAERLRRQVPSWLVLRIGLSRFDEPSYQDLTTVPPGGWHDLMRLISHYCSVHSLRFYPQSRPSLTTPKFLPSNFGRLTQPTAATRKAIFSPTSFPTTQQTTFATAPNIANMAVARGAHVDGSTSLDMDQITSQLSTL